jgi:hypothetical protein
LFIINKIIRQDMVVLTKEKSFSDNYLVIIRLELLA